MFKKTNKPSSGNRNIQQGYVYNMHSFEIQQQSTNLKYKHNCKRKLRVPDDSHVL